MLPPEVELMMPCDNYEVELMMPCDNCVVELMMPCDNFIILSLTKPALSDHICAKKCGILKEEVSL